MYLPNLVRWLEETIVKKNHFEFTLSNLKESFKKKPRRLIKQRKSVRMSYICFWGHWEGEWTSKSVQYKFTKLGRMTATCPKEGAKIVSKLLILTRRPVLRKNQGGPSNREKLRECLIFDSGCTGWQSTPENLLNINLSNLVGCLQNPLRKVQKLFGSLQFYLESKLSEKSKQHHEKKKKRAIWDFGCTGWQSTPQNIFNNNLPKLVGWLQQTLRKEQKLLWSYSF